LSLSLSNHSITTPTAFVPIIVKSFDNGVYCKLLEQCVLPVLRRMKGTLPNVQFQQDNVPVHKAQDILRWFEQNDVRVMEWPPYPPDLEHVWVKLKDRAQKMYPGPKDTTGGPAKVRKRLAEVLPKVWDSIEL
jgi:hypothetical protein